MLLNLLDRVPSFVAAQPDGGQLNYETFARGKWSVIFSYLADFTPVCLTEMAEFSLFQEHFNKRNCGLVAISPDSPESHREWLEDVSSVSGTKVDFPVVSDESGDILMRLGFLAQEPGSLKRIKGASPTRGLYIVDPDLLVQFVMVMPQTTGRSVKEVLRVLDALQLSVFHKFVATPAEWTPGLDVVELPDLTQNRLALRKATHEEKNGGGNKFRYLKFVRLSEEDEK
jgi:alkyl hydroperoxide reductase subunit AhpC